VTDERFHDQRVVTPVRNGYAWISVSSHGEDCFLLSGADLSDLTLFQEMLRSWSGSSKAEVDIDSPASLEGQ
jgi:hypothetical protein